MRVVDSILIPRHAFEALHDPKWVGVIMKEMRALECNHTWDLVTLPSGQKTVACKRVFTIKYRADGTVERYKTHLVTKGFTQVSGKDFFATFAPVAKLNIARLLVSLAASHSWPLHQLDVKNATLNGLYVASTRFSGAGGVQWESLSPEEIIYNLKGSPRAWFGRFSSVVLSLGFTRCHSDHTCFMRRNFTGQLTILLVYVDDVILTGDDLIGKAFYCHSSCVFSR